MQGGSMGSEARRRGGSGEEVGKPEGRKTGKAGIPEGWKARRKAEHEQLRRLYGSPRGTTRPLVEEPFVHFVDTFH